MLTSTELPHLHGVTGVNCVRSGSQIIDHITRSTASSRLSRTAVQQDCGLGTYMRNARWLASLGHVFAQVFCAIAKSNFAAAARKESEK